MLAVFQEDVFAKRVGAIQEYVCKILTGCKPLWAVPVVLDVFFQVADRKRFGSTPYYLSLLLEKNRGSIADGPQVIPKEHAPAEGPMAGLFDEEFIEYDDANYQSAVL